MGLADDLMAAGAAVLAAVNETAAVLYLSAAGDAQNVTGSFVRGEMAQTSEGMSRENEKRGEFVLATAGVDGVDAVVANTDTVVIGGETWTIARELERSGGHVVWELMAREVDVVRKEGRILEQLR